MPLSKEGLPNPGHDQWFGPFFRFVRWMLSILTGGSKMLLADVATLKPLAANTYANGTAGVGATLTANANGAFPTINGVVPFVGMFILVAGEATAANNGLYTLTTMGSSSTAWVLTRATSLNASALFVPGIKIGIKDSDTTYGGLAFEYCGAAAPTMGSTALTFLANVKLGRNCGVVPSTRLPFTVNPANTNTLVIGTWTLTFVTSLGAVGATTQVLIGGTAAATLTNLINAINGDAASKGTTWQEQTTPATTALFADAVSTNLRLRGATARGGVPVAQKFASTALSNTIAGGGSFTVDNLNLMGKADTDVLEASGNLTVDAALVTAAGLAAGVIIELPFTPTVVQWMVTTSAGALKSNVTDTLVAVAGGLQFNTAGATHVAATDVISFWAQQ